MALSNTAVPKYYGMFRDAVMRGEIPVNKEISMEMNRIDDLIANPGIYYDGEVVEGWIKYCEEELTLTDGSELEAASTALSFGANRSLVGITLWSAACMSRMKMARRALRPQIHQETAYQQAIPDCCPRRRQVAV